MKDENAFNWNKFNIPAWLVTVCGVAIAVGSAKADVENLKNDVNALKPLTEAVAVFKAQIPRMDRDIQEIKISQNEIQKDIKTLLSRR